jgi:SsrA-binding protein
MGDDGGPRTIASNKRAFHDYFVEERYEAGLVLTGSEVKSLREGKANLRDAYARVLNDEAFLLGAHISPYAAASYQNHDPTRTRKLLLHRKEIQRLIGKTTRKGLTLVPLRLYWKDGRAKVELGLARGKREYDKRETERRREAQREIAKVMKAGRRGG